MSATVGELREQHADALHVLDARIRDLLTESDDAAPTTLAEAIRLRPDERRALVWWGLVERVERSVRVQRQQQMTKLGIASTASVTSERTQILNQKSPEEIEHEAEQYRAWRDDLDARFRAEQLALIDGFAAEMRRDGIRIGLAQARTQRVSVAGEWMMLADCTADDLRHLASEYEQRAASNAERGAYFTALADQVEAGGFVTVEAMCEAQDDA